MLEVEAPTLRIRSPSEDSHYHDENVIGPPIFIMSQWDWIPRARLEVPHHFWVDKDSWLVVEPTHLKNMSSSIGRIITNIWKKPVPNHPPDRG